MGAATENNKIQDPLGLQTFALSESAYDLVCSIEGIYGRMIYDEMEKVNPNQDQIDTWWWKSQELTDNYQNLDWNDFGSVEKFIERCAREWHNLQALEITQPLPVVHVYHC